MSLPWQVQGQGDFWIVDDQDQCLASISYDASVDDCDPLNSPEGRRATLMAAAPELLAALESLVDAMDPNLTVEFRALIAKVKGGQ